MHIASLFAAFLLTGCASLSKWLTPSDEQAQEEVRGTEPADGVAPLSSLQKYERDFYGAYSRELPEHHAMDAGDNPSAIDEALADLERRRVMGLVSEEAYLRMRQYLLSGGALPSSQHSSNTPGAGARDRAQ